MVPEVARKFKLESVSAPTDRVLRRRLHQVRHLDRPHHLVTMDQLLAQLEMNPYRFKELTARSVPQNVEMTDPAPQMFRLV